MRLVGKGLHLVRDNGTSWPTPGDHPDGGLEWRLRYGSEAQLVKDRFSAASVVEAYRALIMLPQRERNAVIRDLRSAIKQQWHALTVISPHE